MVRRRVSPTEPFDGLECLRLRRIARGAFGAEYVMPTKSPRFRTRWRTYGADVVAWGDAFDVKYQLPQRTAAWLTEAFGDPRTTRSAP